MRQMMLVAVAGCAAGILIPAFVRGHCQIPCGIYDDGARFVLLREHVTTIEKSMKTIQGLSRGKDNNSNQLVRWVNNKEAHADKLTEIVTHYFLAQRVKPVGPGNSEARGKYVEQLTLLHGMIVHSMKAKQTTDLAHVEKLRELIGTFEASYLGKKGG